MTLRLSFLAKQHVDDEPTPCSRYSTHSHALVPSPRQLSLSSLLRADV